MEDKIWCYRFLCERYPDCARAKGKGCCIEKPESDDGVRLLAYGECGKENDYPYFLPEQGRRPSFR